MVIWSGWTRGNVCGNLGERERGKLSAIFELHSVLWSSSRANLQAGDVHDQVSAAWIAPYPYLLVRQTQLR